MLNVRFTKDNFDGFIENLYKDFIVLIFFIILLEICSFIIEKIPTEYLFIIGYFLIIINAL